MANQKAIDEVTARLAAERDATEAAKRADIAAAGQELRKTLTTRERELEAARAQLRSEYEARRASEAAAQQEARKGAVRAAWIHNGGTEQAFEAAWPDIERTLQTEDAINKARSVTAQTRRMVRNAF